jgi:hypothetical protein
MSKNKKTKTDQTQNTNYNNTSGYNWFTPTDTADTKAFRDWKPQIDPGLGYQYGRARNDLKNSFLNPLGGFSSPQIADAQLRTGMSRLNEQESQSFRQGQNDVNTQRGSQLGSLAALTAPRLAQTSSSGSSTGTGTSTTTQPSGLFGDLASGAMTGIMALLM